MTSAELDNLALAAGGNIWRAALLGDSALALRGCTAAREILRESSEYGLLIRLPWRDRVIGLEGEPSGIRLRSPCKHCGHVGGIAQLTNGQHVVRCSGCATYAYCAPRAEAASW